LEINGRFLAVGLVSVPLNLAVIATILFTRDMDHRMLAWGVVIGYAASFLMLYICSKRIGFSYSPYLDLRSPHIHKLAIMVVPVFLGKTINQINILIDRTIASTLPEGSISSINYANRIIGFVTSVFVISVATAIYPKLSTLSAENDKATIKKTFGSSISIISYIVLPLSAGLIILAKPVVSLMFERGAFTSFDVERTAEVIVFYAMGLLFFSIKEIAINVFYAIQDMKTPMINSAIAIVLNFGLNLMLIQTMQHKGLALATTVSGAVTLVLMLIVMRRKLGPMGFSDIFTSLLKMLIASAVMSCVVYPLYNVLSGIFSSVIVTFGISVFCGMAVYFIMSAVLRIKEFRIIITTIIERLGHRTKKDSL